MRHQPRKRFGQNFLVDHQIINQIISTISPKNDDCIIEIGPGKVLTGMVKRTIKNANCFSINSIADIKNLKDEFKK